MLTLPVLCEAGYGNLGDDLSLLLVCDEIRKIFKYDVDIRPYTFTQVMSGHIPPGNGFALVGPGTLLSMNDNEWNRQMALLVDRGWTFGFTGTGIAHPKDFGESSQGKMLLGRILHHSPLLWLRGQKSHDYAAEAISYYCEESGDDARTKNRCIGDPIGLFYDAPGEVKTDGTVLINFGYTAYCPKWEIVGKELVKLVHLLKSAGYKPKGWSVWNRHDIWPLKKMCAEAGIEMLKPETKIKALEVQAKKAVAAVTFRLHAGIFAISCKTPTVMINYQHKIRDDCVPFGWRSIVEPDGKLAENVAKMLPALVKNKRQPIAQFNLMAKRMATEAVAALKSEISTYVGP